MAMRFEELDETTRSYMLAEFEAEQASGLAYRPRLLSPAGLRAFQSLTRSALSSGCERDLIELLSNPEYWLATEPYERRGVRRERRVNFRQAAERLGLTEFNTCYVRGLSKKLMEEGVAQCEVYRADMPKWEPAECTQHEGEIHDVDLIYLGHRARYWPEPGDPTAFSVPLGPSCHHSIRRVAA